MTPSRRDFARLAAAGLAAGFGATPARADVPLAAIVAEGGAAEEQIEDTGPAFDTAISQGCDFLQVNLVPTKEGALVARRSPELSAGTDVGDRPEFADRKTTRTIDGVDLTGWFSDDFTLAELQTLTCREARPEQRPGNVKLNGKAPILTIAEVLATARAGCVRTARTIGVCARTLHSGYYEELGLDVVARLADELGTAGYVAAAAAAWMQSSEPDALRAFGKLSRVRRMLLIEPADAPRATTSDALAATRAFAEAIGPNQDLLIDPAAASFPAPTTLALDAHNAGLQVFSRTVRPQNQFLPPALRRGDPNAAAFPNQRGDSDKMLLALFADRVDGVCTDMISAAAGARRNAAEAIARARSGRD